MQPSQFPIPALLPVLLAAGVFIAACGDRGAPKQTGQVVARVNGDEVTVHQLNATLARLNQPNPGETLSKQVLDSLVDQQLLVQEAIEKKYDRDPQVVQALDAARRQILAQAALERALNVSQPTPEQVREFYAKYPDLFQKRRTYAFHEFVIERSKFGDALRGKLDAAKSPTDVIAILRADDIGYREAKGSRSAEQLPLELLPRIAGMKRGDIVVLQDAANATILQLTDSVDAPVTEQQAGPLITQYLVNLRKREAGEAKLKELRAAAKIEYLGPFAGKTDAKPDQVAPTQAPAPAPQAAQPAPAQEHIEKGVAGLKK